MRNNSVQSLVLLVILAGCFPRLDDADSTDLGAMGDQALADQYALDQGVADRGVGVRGADQNVVDQNVVDQDVVDQDIVDQDVVDQNVVDQNVVDQNVVDQNVVDQNVVDQDVVDQDVVDQDVVDQNVVDQNVVDQDVVDLGDIDRRVDQGLADQTVPDRGAECAADEVCDGLDNDCDGVADEGLLNACRACGPLPDDTCDGRDNDCDGRVDEGLGAIAEVCDSADNDCDGRIDEQVERTREICDGVDNDCDGRTDEDVDDFIELCDGLDNDCDGRVDEAANGVGEDCGRGFGACRRLGLLQCLDGALTCGARPGAPAEEVFNHIDDDCDGRLDEGFVGEACEAGCGGDLLGCPDGGACDALECRRPAEVCADLLDNDCDGAIDEHAATRRLPPDLTDFIVHGQTLIAWGDSRIGRYTLDGRALEVANLDGFGTIQSVVPTAAGFGVFGHVDLFDAQWRFAPSGWDWLVGARALMFVHLDAQLRVTSDPVAWLTAPIRCALPERETVLRAVVSVADGFLAVYSDPCRAPAMSLAAIKLNAEGRPVGAPTVLREAPCGWADIELDLRAERCRVIARRVEDQIFVLGRSAYDLDQDFYGVPSLWTLNADAAVLSRHDLPQELGRVWRYTLEVIADTPLFAMAAEPMRSCNTLGGYRLMHRFPVGTALLTATPSGQPGPRTIFSAVRDQRLVTAWAENSRVMMTSASPDALEAQTASVVADLADEEALLGIAAGPDDRFTLVTSMDGRMGTRTVGWPTCDGVDQDCDGEVDEHCPANAECRSRSTWYRPGGYWTALAGGDPGDWPAISHLPMMDQTLDPCGRLVGARRVNSWHPRTPRRCELAIDFDTSVLTEQYRYDGDGNLVEHNSLLIDIRNEFGYGRDIEHTHDMRGARIRTVARQDCDRVGCEMYAPMALQIQYTNDEQGRLIREEADRFPRPRFGEPDEPDGVDRISTFVWDDAAGVVIEDIDHDANGEPDERVVHPIL